MTYNVFGGTLNLAQLNNSVSMFIYVHEVPLYSFHKGIVWLWA